MSAGRKRVNPRKVKLAAEHQARSVDRALAHPIALARPAGLIRPTAAGDSAPATVPIVRLGAPRIGNARGDPSAFLLPDSGSVSHPAAISACQPNVQPPT